MLVGFVNAWCQFDSFMTSLYLVAELNKRMKDGEDVSYNVVKPKKMCHFLPDVISFWFSSHVLYVFGCL